MTSTLPSAYSRFFDLWAHASMRRQTTVDGYYKVFASFVKFVQGKDPASVSRLDILGFRDFLAGHGQSPATVTNKIGILKTLFRVARDYELLDGDPAGQVKVVHQDSIQQKSRIAFSPEDLLRIFNSRIYTDDYRPASGGKDACYWLPLLALFTGARVEELAQLLVKDIRRAEGLGWYIDINDEAEHSQLKNAASRRRVPLHRILLDCGFLDYVQSVREFRFLFPALKPNSRHKRGGYFSAFFSGYLRKRVGITDKRKVFHSFRHTFKDICRKVGIDEPVHDALSGHTTPHAGRRYGNEHYPLEPLFDAMEHFEIEGFDVSHLYTDSAVTRVSRPEATVISAYHGIVLAFIRPRGRSAMPCLHARCQGAEASFSILDNAILSGSLPFSKQVLVQAWIEIHRDELLINWENGKRQREFFRIDPLR